MTNNRPRSDYTRDRDNVYSFYQRLPNAVKETIADLFDTLGIRPHLALLFNSGLRQRGWFDSFRSSPVDQNGNPLPWMPYCFIDFIETRLDRSMRVFEFGSGNSTKWFAMNVNEIIAVEDDKQWYEKTQDNLPKNATVLHRSGEEYESSIVGREEFDVVSIDGIRRSKCVEKAVSHLTDTGVIIWDDSDRTQYQEAHEMLNRLGFKSLFFQGMGPVSASLQRTSIFYKQDNCIGI